MRGLRSIPTRDAIVSHARGCQRAVNAMLRSSSGVPIWGNTTGTAWSATAIIHTDDYIIPNFKLGGYYPEKLNLPKNYDHININYIKNDS